MNHDEGYQLELEQREQEEKDEYESWLDSQGYYKWWNYLETNDGKYEVME